MHMILCSTRHGLVHSTMHITSPPEQTNRCVIHHCPIALPDMQRESLADVLSAPADPETLKPWSLELSGCWAISVLTQYNMKMGTIYDCIEVHPYMRPSCYQQHDQWACNLEFVLHKVLYFFVGMLYFVSVLKCIVLAVWWKLADTWSGTCFCEISCPEL